MNASRIRQFGDETGAAVISAMMVMLLMAGVTAGFTALVITDTRVRSLDSTRTQSFYAVHAGLEKLTADLGDLFHVNVAPTGAQVNALMAAPPAIGVTWQQPDGTSGYRVTFPADGAGNPVASIMTVQNGPFQGLVGMATPYSMTATGRLADRSEAALTRTLQTVAIPVFQFGIFSENDLSFFAGPNFNFGGRVHTNSNLFLAEGNGNTLTLQDRVTAFGEVVRTNLSNGWDTTANYLGTVNPITAPATFRALARTEGSLTGTIGSPRNEPTWTNLSTGNYNHNIMTGNTGARRLDLPITQVGASPVDLIKRPVLDENVTNPNVLAERFYTLASLRILLADTAAPITAPALPGLTGTAPVPLGLVEPYVVASAPPRPPFAQTPNAAGTLGVRAPINTPLLGGFIKIEKQTAPGVWVDVTLEILNLGIGSPAYRDSNTVSNGGLICADKFPNAILRLQRELDNAGACYTLAGATTNASAPWRYVANTLYDPREALLRDVDPGTMQWGGIVHYIELDAANLARWFRGQIPAANCPIACTGGNALNVNGYTVYFSDRRGNNSGTVAVPIDTGEYGFEDIVNPTVANGTPNGVLNTGEDFNGTNTLQTYGQNALWPVAGMTFPFCTAGQLLVAPCTVALYSRPWTSIDPTNIYGAAEEAQIARRNPAVFFRRALKVTNGSNLVGVAPGLTGLTIVSENPVYLQGNWNANGSFVGNHVATSIIADALTLLSNNWNDRNSFDFPHDHDNAAQRNAATTWYRLGVIAGKGISFPQPAGTGQDFGTDGGAHNFLRYIEDWNGDTLNYLGSIVSLYTSRQAVGTYKCCTTVYSPPTRGYNFDVEFLTPALLPPRTPMFRDVNITGFAQIIKP